MFNVTGGEIVLILLLGLIVLGPERLPEAMRKAGKLWGELRKMSSSFQDEVRKGFEEPVTEIKKTTTTMRTAASIATSPVKAVQKEITKAVTGAGTASSGTAKPTTKAADDETAAAAPEVTPTEATPAEATPTEATPTEAPVMDDGTAAADAAGESSEAAEVPSTEAAETVDVDAESDAEPHAS